MILRRTRSCGRSRPASRQMAEYYAGEGKDDGVVIELPKGGYTPVFRTGNLSANPPPPKEYRRRIRPIARGGGLRWPGARLAWWQIRHQSEPITIAVSPLENLSHDPASDYFADGLTDELIRNLSLIEGLSTRSRTSSFAFKGKPRNVREVGKELKTIMSWKVPSCGSASSCASTPSWFACAMIFLFGRGATIAG